MVIGPPDAQARRTFSLFPSRATPQVSSMNKMVQRAARRRHLLYPGAGKRSRYGSDDARRDRLT